MAKITQRFFQIFLVDVLGFHIDLEGFAALAKQQRIASKVILMALAVF